MKIRVSSVRSIKKAEIDFEGICMLTGLNMSGKTSLLRAIAAGFRGSAKIYGATKADSSAVVRDGEKTASVLISSGVENGDGQMTWSHGVMWPEGQVMANGTPPAVNDITLGRVNPVAAYDTKQWAAFIREIAPGEHKVTANGIGKHLSKLDQHDKDKMDAISNLLRSGGWDQAEEMAKKRARECRRDWETATGDKFGKAKADGWVAEGYADLDDVGELQAREKDLRAELARSEVKTEVMGGQRFDLVEEIQELGGQANAFGSEFREIEKRVKAIVEELSNYPISDPLVCPCCEAKLDYRGGALHEHEVTDYVRGSDRHNELIDERDRLDADYEKKKEASGRVHAKLQAAQATLKKIDESEGDCRETAVIKDEIDNLSAMINAFMKTEKATKMFAEWRYWTAASELLSPTGIRFEATKAAAIDLQPQLDRLAAMVFPNHKLEIDPTSEGLDVLIDGRPYQAMVDDGDPNSYALALQAIFQVLSAIKLGDSAPIIIDRADTAKKTRLGGILRAIVKSGVPAIMAKAVDERPTEDKLAKAGVGQTLWIDDGGNVVPAVEG